MKVLGYGIKSVCGMWCRFATLSVVYKVHLNMDDEWVKSYIEQFGMKASFF